MGCSSSRQEMSEEESYLQDLEQELGYQNHQVQEVDLIHRKYSFGGSINDSHFNHIVNHLKLAVSYSNAQENIKAFYQQFKGEEAYHLEPLLVIGIFLSSGSAEIKAKLLFEAFDHFDNKVLDREAYLKMFKTMFDVNVKKLKILAEQKNPKNDHAIVFLEEIERGGKLFKKAFMNDILGDGDNCTLEGFVDKFRGKDKQHFMTTLGFRKELRSCWKNEHKKQKMSKDHEKEGKTE
ncbi:hypothetical protein SteCoe_8210 [Stentor coeruleus]|uniref:Uncharacterized protein n=1 Tax=Stentor coeruleus TaxID=5963 RepID=A0A1R2CKP2_9CILI|nr:hypothetical protein SteCoe_8210 [Stentor coeruleus]